MSRLPIYLNRAVGYAMNRLQQPESGRLSDEQIVENIVARGEAFSDQQARAALRQARQNVNATNRVHQRTEAASLRAACGYKCDDSTRIGLRIRFEYVPRPGADPRPASVVVNVAAGTTIQQALALGTDSFLRRLRAGSDTPSMHPTITSTIDVGAIDAVAIGGYEGAYER